jgi:hypothetical protein
MSPTVQYQNPQFLLYGLTFLMLTPSPLQEALLGPADAGTGATPNPPLPPFDEVDPGTVQNIQNVLGNLGFQNPAFVWTQFGAYLVHLTQLDIRDTLGSVLVNVLEDEYIGDPPCPPPDDTKALVGSLEGLAGAQANPGMMERVNRRIEETRGIEAGDERA